MIYSQDCRQWAIGLSIPHFLPVLKEFNKVACEQAFGRAGNWGEGPPPFLFLRYFFPQKEPRACSQAINKVAFTPKDLHEIWVYPWRIRAYPWKISWNVDFFLVVCSMYLSLWLSWLWKVTWIFKRYYAFINNDERTINYSLPIAAALLTTELCGTKNVTDKLRPKITHGVAKSQTSLSLLS